MHNTCSIRPATLADDHVLSQLAGRTFPLGCPQDTDPKHLAAFIASELTAERFREFISSDGVTILLAEAESKLAGFAMLVADCPHPQIAAQSPIELRKFYVDLPYHGHGVAHALMQAAIPILEDQRFDAAWLSVYSGNARAISFYEKWGFKTVGTHYFKVGSDPQQDFVMRRDRSRGTE